MPVARNTWQPSLILKPASAVRRRIDAHRRPDIGREHDRVALTVPIALWAGPGEG